MGNESCDLDSAVSAISLAYFYEKIKSQTDEAGFLPILNIPRRDFPLKTEVHFLLKKYAITPDCLTFRDELTDDFLKANRIMLVDHHVSPWSEKAIAIYDHRPRDTAAIIPDACQLNLQLVGSCATLISELFIQKNMLGEDVIDVLQLLRSTIILDTVNFSKEAGRATPKDFEICSVLEEALCSLTGAILSKEELFKSLVKARSDISSLTAGQLLRKDLKIITSNKPQSLKIALPGFPMTVQQFILKPNAAEEIQQFAKENDCAVILLMGMYVSDDDSVHRDLGLININNKDLYSAIKQKLVILEEPQLSLEFYQDCNFMDGSFFKQGNIKATRKHILPVVKSILDN